VQIRCVFDSEMKMSERFDAIFKTINYQLRQLLRPVAKSLSVEASNSVT
jgi:hypothetical protein